MIWREWGIPRGELRSVSINGVYHKEQLYNLEALRQNGGSLEILQMTSSEPKFGRKHQSNMEIQNC